MPAKYSHVKKRSASGLLKKSGQSTTRTVKDNINGNSNSNAKGGYRDRHYYTQKNGHYHSHHKPNPHVDRSISQAVAAVSQLERAIARILLLRYDQDIARLYSTRLYNLSLIHLPTFVMRCLSLGGPGWLAWNYNCEEIKDFLRAVISMDMRQAGERVATKSVLWSYTALRHFAMSNNVPVCSKRGLHSMRLVPYYSSLKAHLDVLESMPAPTFTKPPHLGSLEEGQIALENACEHMPQNSEWDDDWQLKVRYGYEKLSQVLWKVAREFDVRGYGLVLREKLTNKWCECGCSTDHLGEVCERTVREEEEENGVRLGKQREWDGRGSGVYGWETEAEEDIWEVELDIEGTGHQQQGGGKTGEKKASTAEPAVTIGEMMEWRYLSAEREKEQGNKAFKKGDFKTAVKHYESAYEIEPEIPHYQLNLAAAHLKLNNWIEAEKACTKALIQHKSVKGLYRRARARRMLGRHDEAIKDLQVLLKLQPHNVEAVNELMSLALLTPLSSPSVSSTSSSSRMPSSSSSYSPSTTSPSSSSTVHEQTNNQHHLATDDILKRFGVPRPKTPKDPPFTKTHDDEKKLKVFAMSSSASSSKFGICNANGCVFGDGNCPFTNLNVDLDVDFADMSPMNILAALGLECLSKVEHEGCSGCSHWKTFLQEKVKERSGNKKGRDRARNGKGKVKEKVKSQKVKEIESMRAEGIVYPSWERYSVKLA